jgi:hypothetical protein
MKTINAAILFAAFWIADCVGQDNYRLPVLKACENFFGAPINAKSNLFEINPLSVSLSRTSRCLGFL